MKWLQRVLGSSGRVFGSRYRIVRNVLLAGEGKGLDLERFLTLKKVADLGDASFMGREANLALITEDFARQVHEAYGDAGLLELVLLVRGQDRPDVTHFLEPIEGIMALDSAVDEPEEMELVPDADLPRAFDGSAPLATRALRTDWARRLYRPGLHAAASVYGLGGPRILVSCPRSEGELLSGARQVLTGLLVRGFRGRFHVLGPSQGLDAQVNGLAAQDAWFSLVAAHSDLVVFVRDSARGLDARQERELCFLPPWVRAKIVDLPASGGQGDSLPVSSGEAPRVYFEDGAILSEEAWRRKEAERSIALVREFVTGQGPRDRWSCRDEAGRVTEYPLDFDVYGVGRS